MIEYLVQGPYAAEKGTHATVRIRLSKKLLNDPKFDVADFLYTEGLKFLRPLYAELAPPIKIDRNDLAVSVRP